MIKDNCYHIGKHITEIQGLYLNYTFNSWQDAVLYSDTIMNKVSPSLVYLLFSINHIFTKYGKCFMVNFDILNFL